MLTWLCIQPFFEEKSTPIDRKDVRKKILSILYTPWKKRGFSKGKLNYMKKNVKAEKQFTLNKQVSERVKL